MEGIKFGWTKLEGQVAELQEAGNPVMYYKDLGWYFWDEAQWEALGPFNTKEECEDSCTRYYKEL